MNRPDHQTDNPEEDGVHKNFEQSLLTERVCYNCHHLNPAYRKFCHKCGATLVQLPSQLKPPGPD